jgi:hypothetical protein
LLKKDVVVWEIDGDRNLFLALRNVIAVLIDLMIWAIALILSFENRRSPQKMLYHKSIAFKLEPNESSPNPRT